MRTHRGFWFDTLRWIGWFTAGTVVLIAGLALLSGGGSTPDEPLPPATTVTEVVPDEPLPPATTNEAATEDSKGWNCATQGNHVCGPGSGHPAGCYSGGMLVIPWTQYDNPKLDPLWAQVDPPC